MCWTSGCVVGREEPELAVGDGQRLGVEHRRGDRAERDAPVAAGSSMNCTTSSATIVSRNSAGVPACSPARRGRDVRVRDRARAGGRRDPAGHPLGELDRLDRRPRATGAGGVAVVRDRPAPVGREERARALGEPGDREQRVHAERPRDHRRVHHVETVVHLGAGRPGEHPAAIVDDARRPRSRAIGQPPSGCTVTSGWSWSALHVGFATYAPPSAVLAIAQGVARALHVRLVADVAPVDADAVLVARA